MFKLLYNVYNVVWEQLENVHGTPPTFKLTKSYKLFLFYFNNKCSYETSEINWMKKKEEKKIGLKQITAHSYSQTYNTFVLISIAK